MDKEQMVFHMPPVYDALPLEVLIAILDQFPYKLHISRADGVMIYANPCFLEGLMEYTQANALGSYNVLDDPALESWGIRDHVMRAFSGETILTQGVRFPGKELAGVVVGKEEAFHHLFQDIFSYPIRNGAGQLTHVVTYFVPVNNAPRHYGVMAAKSFIETHWTEPLTVDAIAGAVKLSPSRLSELFREETGFTLHDYHLEVKLRHLRELLLYPNHSIQKAFEMVGFAYNSHYVKMFRKATGMSPRQYRQQRTSLSCL